jgi:hypothetical protein
VRNRGKRKLFYPKISLLPTPESDDSAIGPEQKGKLGEL